MRHLTIPVALAVLFTVAGCGKTDSGSTSSSSTAGSTTTSPAAAPAPSTAATPAPAPEASPPAASTPSTAASSASGSGGSASASATGGSPTAAAGTSGSTQTASAGASGGNGEATYNQTCVACHGAGVAGAPKIGDKADWGPRIAQGKDTLYTHALQGFQGKKGVMPPKGGNTTLADADVKAAVDYMVSKAQ